MKRLENIHLGITKEFDIDVYYEGALQDVRQHKVTLYMMDGDTEIKYEGDVTNASNGRVSFIIQDDDRELEAIQYDYKFIWELNDKTRLLSKDKTKVTEV